MPYASEEIARTLKATREAKGLSQRALGAKSGLTQAHLSRIENGSVDVRLSNLIELARTLDLEVTLVPRQTLPAVRSIARGAMRPGQPVALDQPRPAYRLDDDADG
jgi:transcriptional regulator with XRE-family HTH domain